jgi:16S rRNA (cytidine1402-2'-O)-methyltransferase
MTPGTLYVVATPIGNLEDMTFRAVRLLKTVDVVACEDTRQTRVLLDHYQIEARLISFFEHNELARIPQLIGMLNEGKQIAVVSDAGTPTVSDPAFRLVREARRHGIPVVPVPGACAAIAAVCAGGLPTDRFVFEGFLPLKKGRKTRWTELQNEDRTIVLYESPHRLLKTLGEIHDFLGDRPVVVARELTKKFEEINRGTAAEMLAHFQKNPPRGEFVVLIAGRRYSGKTESE